MAMDIRIKTKNVNARTTSKETDSRTKKQKNGKTAKRDDRARQKHDGPQPYAAYVVYLTKAGPDRFALAHVIRQFFVAMNPQFDIARALEMARAMTDSACALRPYPVTVKPRTEENRAACRRLCKGLVAVGAECHRAAIVWEGK